jgi:hypothetical protein
MRTATNGDIDRVIHDGFAEAAAVTLRKLADGYERTAADMRPVRLWYEQGVVDTLEAVARNIRDIADGIEKP